MTPDEHQTRAMLLGRVYDESLHVYTDYSKLGGTNARHLDATTLRPILYDEYIDRLNRTIPANVEIP